MGTQGLDLRVSPTTLLQRCAHEPYAFVLDGGSPSSWGSGKALLGFRPRARLLVLASGAAWVHRDGVSECWTGDPFTLLDRFCAEVTPRRTDAEAPLAGGVIAALGYDLRHWVERLPRSAQDDASVPVLHAAFYDWLLSYSYAERCYRLASCGRSVTDMQHLGDELAEMASSPVALPAPPAAHVVADFSPEQYLSKVEAVLEYIAAGDVYQVNLAQRFLVTHPPSPATLFATLQRQHPVPFAAYVDAGDCVLVSNSPECFLTLRDDVVATFPIKGTRPRGTDARRDAAQAEALQRHPKERAEHVMIVDLERNDLGRVCRIGSVHVAEFARVHTFPTLHHMVSKVVGRLRPGTALSALLRATFPGGSITGAPKVRAMEIIDEIESVPRGFYTGAIGVIGLDGSATFNLAIRTAVATAHQFAYHAGGGVVADSIPVSEYEETLLKARAFFTALGSPLA